MVENWLKYAGREVARNGWPIVFLKHNDKKPLPYRWLKDKPPTLERVKRMIAAGKRCGIGIICGNVIALDNDYELGGPVTKEFLDAVRELREHFFPKVLLRRGRPTREPTAVFRLDDDEMFRSCNIGAFQILAKGRQFVAYNNHPETKKPFRWLERGEGEPKTLAIDDAPSYPRKTLERFISALQILEDAFGLSAQNGGDILERIKRGEIDRAPDELVVEESLIRMACKHIKNDEAWGWEEWNRNLMMPLWAASRGDTWGLELAHEVSKQHISYDKDETDKRWEEIGRSPPTRIGGGTLIWLARKCGMPNLGPRDWDNFRAFRDRAELLNVKTSMWMQPGSFENEYARNREKGLTTCATFWQARPAQCYDTIIWDPSAPYGHYERGDESLWNLCRMPEDHGDSGDIGPWEELMRNLYGDHYETIVKRMAYDVQYPARKPMWHELIIGKQGSGKNLNKSPLRNWFGSMAVTINAAEFESSFNSFVSHRKHIELVETASIDSKTFNKHKEIFASDDSWIVVNEKYQRPYKVRNVLSLWISSNEVDALSLSPDERRMYVVRKTTPMLSKAKLIKIADWLKVEKNWKAVIWHLTYEVEVDEEFGQQLPGVTSDMMELVETAGRMHDRIRDKMRKALNGCSLYSMKDLHDKFIEAGIYERPGVLIHMETLRRAAIAEGHRKVRGGERVKLEYHGGGDYSTKKILWTVDPDLVDAQNPTLRLIYETQSPIFSPDGDE